MIEALAKALKVEVSAIHPIAETRFFECNERYYFIPPKALDLKLWSAWRFFAEVDHYLIYTPLDI